MDSATPALTTDAPTATSLRSTSVPLAFQATLPQVDLASINALNNNALPALPQTPVNVTPASLDIMLIKTQHSACNVHTLQDAWFAFPTSHRSASLAHLDFT